MIVLLCLICLIVGIMIGGVIVLLMSKVRCDGDLYVLTKDGEQPIIYAALRDEPESLKNGEYVLLQLRRNSQK